LAGEVFKPVNSFGVEKETFARSWPDSEEKKVAIQGTLGGGKAQ